MTAPPQTALSPDEYAVILTRVSRASGPAEDLVSGLDVHTKRKVVQYQVSLNQPVLRACVTSDMRLFLRKQGYRAGYTNASRSAKYLIKPANAVHKRVMIFDTPERKAQSDRTSPSVLLAGIGSQVEQIRIEQDVSLNDLARFAQLSPSTLSDLRSGKGNFTLTSVERFFNQMGYDVLGVQIEKKLSRRKPMQP